MLNIFERFNLQLFAEGVPGDAGVAEPTPGVSPVDAGQGTGVSTAAAGQNAQARSLESLGVPKDKAEKYRALKAKSKLAPAPAAEVEAEPAAASAEPAKEKPEQVAAAEAEATKAETNSFDWDALKNNSEFKRKMSEVVSARVKEYKDVLDAMAPMISILGEKFGVDTSDPGKTDYAALSKAVVDNDWFYEDAANRAGQEVSTYKKNVQRDIEYDARNRDLSRREDAFKEVLEQVAARNYEERLKADAAELKKQFPSFDLEKEMANPRFKAMVSPGGGLTLQQAYRAFHYREIEEGIAANTAQQVQKAITSSIQTGRKIPAENGASRAGNPPVGRKFYSQMTEAEKAEYERSLRAGRIRY